MKKTITLISILLFIIIGGITFYKITTSTDYKLKKQGYSKEEILIINKKLNTDSEKLLNYNFNTKNIEFIKQKYFNIDKLDIYINYQKENKKVTTKDIISLVNIGAHKEKFKDSKKTDTSKNSLMLVNKYNKLTENYDPKDLVKISSVYSYGENYIKEEVLDNFIAMFNSAKEENLTLIINSAYRSFKEQEDIYNSIKLTSGSKVDEKAARPGFSEHQTGLALDIITYNSKGSEFDSTDEFKWLQENAHKFGFILRYPKDKEHLTGYNYESWHYRYVGKDMAKKVLESNLTYEEYYTYYIEGKNND